MPKWSTVRKIFSPATNLQPEWQLKMSEIVILKLVPQLITNLCPVPLESRACHTQNFGGLPFGMIHHKFADAFSFRVKTVEFFI